MVSVSIEDNSNAEVFACIGSIEAILPFEYVEAGSTVVTLIGTSVFSVWKVEVLIPSDNLVELTDEKIEVSEVIVSFEMLFVLE